MRMGHGTIYLMIAELMFVISGWIIHVGTKRTLGLTDYGIFGILLSLLTLYRIFLASGVNRAVSRFISARPDQAGSIRTRALLLQLILGCFFCLGVWLAAPVLARAWNDPSFTGYIRLTGFFLPVFGLYSVFRGTLNGYRLFGKEALVSIIYSLLKVIGVFTLIYLFTRGANRGVYGAVGGYLGAIVGAAILARVFSPKISGQSEENFPVMKIVRFAFPVVLFSFLISLILHADLYLVRGLMGENAGKATGLYTIAQQFARIPYMFIYALSLTVFPNIAASTAAGDRMITSRTIRLATRGALLLTLPAAALISAGSSPLIGLVYGLDSLAAAAALRYLIFGQTCLAVLMLLATVLTAGGRPWLSFLLVGATLIADVALNLLMIPAGGIRGAALATTIAAGAGMVAGGVLVFFRHRALIKTESLGKIVLGGLVIFSAARFFSPDGWLIIPWLALLGGVYLLIMLACGEIDRNDREMILSLFLKKYRNAEIPDQGPTSTPSATEPPGSPPTL